MEIGGYDLVETCAHVWVNNEINIHYHAVISSYRGKGENG